MTATIAFQGAFLWLTSAAGVLFFLTCRAVFRAVLDRVSEPGCVAWERECSALRERSEKR